MTALDQFARPHKKKSHIGAWIFGILTAIALACGAITIGSLLANGGNDTQANVPGLAVTKPAKTYAGGVPQTHKAIPVQPAPIHDGSWRVGKDVKAGDYKTAGAVKGVIEFCHWSVREGSSTGRIDAAEARDSDTAQGLVTLTKGQVFTTQGCQPWVPAN